MLAKDAEIRSNFRVVSRAFDKKFDKRADKRADKRVDKRDGGWRPNLPSRPKCAKSTRATFTHTTDLREVMIRRRRRSPPRRLMHLRCIARTMDQEGVRTHTAPTAPHHQLTTTTATPRGRTQQLFLGVELMSSSRRLASLLFFVLDSWHHLLVAQVALQGQPSDVVLIPGRRFTLRHAQRRRGAHVRLERDLEGDLCMRRTQAAKVL